MRTFARLLVPWLIALALPLQGTAAAAMLHCAQPRHAAAHEPHAQGVDHRHHGHARAGTEAAAASPDVQGGGFAGHHHAGGKSGCSACASCCSAVAGPAVPIVVGSQRVAETVAAVNSLPAVAFLTGGPERPPRSFSA